MGIHFKVAVVEQNTIKCNRSVCELTEKLSDSLTSFRYSGSTRKKNSIQLDINFDNAFIDKLDAGSWTSERKPRIDMAALKEDWGRPEADAILTHKGKLNFKVVLEIEKSNKKTLWFDFMKLWMFIEAKQAKAGILLCPTNYAHSHGEWNLFAEACRYKDYLRRFAEVSPKKLNRIGIIGYTQLIKVGKEFMPWNAHEFKRVKSEAKNPLA